MNTEQTSKNIFLHKGEDKSIEDKNKNEKANKLMHLMIKIHSHLLYCDGCNICNVMQLREHLEFFFLFILKIFSLIVFVDIFAAVNILVLDIILIFVW